MTKWAYNDNEWNEMIASRPAEVDAIRAVLSEFHGNGADMAAEIIRLRAALDSYADAHIRMLAEVQETS